MSRFIGIYQNALSQNLCSQLITAHQKSNDVTSGRTGSGINKALKDSLDSGLLHKPENSALLNGVLQAFQNTMRQYFIEHPAALVSGMPLIIQNPKTGEKTSINIENFSSLATESIDQVTGALFRYTGFTVQKYKKAEGGYHYFHSEIYPQGEHNEPLHRQVAILLYLNDVEEGGETEFFYQQTKAKPKAGTIVIFPSGFTHTHKGHIPLSNDKYVITAWLLFNRAESIYGAPTPTEA